MSHTLGHTHKLVIDGGCSAPSPGPPPAPSPGQATCQLSHSTPGIDFHSILHASRGGGVVLPPEPIVHSWTMPGVAMAPRIRRTRISDYLPWSWAWVIYFKATVRYHPRLLPHLCSETFCGATPGGPWSVIFGRVSRLGSRSGTRDPSPLRGTAPYCRHAPAVQPSPLQWPWGSPGDIPLAFFIRPLFRLFHCSPLGAAERSDGSVCLVLDLSSPRGASVISGIPRDELRYGIPPVDAATSSASALCGPWIGRSCATCGKSEYMSPSGSLVGPALPPSSSLRSRGRSLDCRTRSRVQPRPPLPR